MSWSTIKTDKTQYYWVRHDGLRPNINSTIKLVDLQLRAFAL